MKTPVYNSAGESVGEMDLPASVFEVEVTSDLVNQIVVSERGNARSSIAHTKTKGEVRGGGKKPWKQKGTGRARAGSIRSPLWKGGGVTFGPRSNRNFSRKVNRSQFRQALFMVLSDRVKDKQLFVLDNLPLTGIKTKEMAKILKNLSDKLKLGKSAALVIPAADKNVEYSSRNLPDFKVLQVKDISPLQLLTYRSTIVLKDAIPAIEKTFSK